MAQQNLTVPIRYFHHNDLTFESISAGGKLNKIEVHGTNTADIVRKSHLV